MTAERPSFPDGGKLPVEGVDVWEEPAIAGWAGSGEHSHSNDSSGMEPALDHLADLPSYGELYHSRRAATHDSSRWWAVLGAAMVGGPLAVLGAFAAQLFGAPASIMGVVVVVVLGPVVEEVLKASGALYLAEQRPWLVPAAWSLVAVAASAGLVFAAVENLLYLNVYIPNPAPELVAWRWVAGPALHGAASTVAGLGVARMWVRVDRHGEPPPWGTATPWLGAAAGLHAVYNGAVVLLESLRSLPG